MQNSCKLKKMRKHIFKQPAIEKAKKTVEKSKVKQKMIKIAKTNSKLKEKKQQKRKKKIKIKETPSEGCRLSRVSADEKNANNGQAWYCSPHEKASGEI